MKICAVILEYRGAEKTRTCLNSLQSQGLTTVIVVDNSEDDGSSERLNQVLNALQNNEPDFALHVITPGTNLGFAGGVNLALQSAHASECDFFFLINNDASAAPGVVQLLANGMIKNDADLVAPTVTDDAGNIQAPLYYQRFFGLVTTQPLPGSYPYLSGCCLMFKRNLFGSGMLLDEDFFMYGEDTLLGWKLRREKKNTIIVHSAIVRHTGQGKWPRCSLFYEYHTARAHVLLAGKTCTTALQRPLLLFTKSIGLLARALRRSIHYRNAIPLKAFFLSWRPLTIRKNQ